MKTIKTGDQVAYSVQFLRSIGAVTGNLPGARGIVASIATYSAGFSLARIDWRDTEIPERVNVKNLAIVGHNSRFSSI